jgi:hypothetical protein
VYEVFMNRLIRKQGHTKPIIYIPSPNDSYKFLFVGIIKISPSNEKVLFNYSYSLKAVGRYKEAIESLTMIITNKNETATNQLDFDVPLGIYTSYIYIYIYV